MHSILSEFCCQVIHTCYCCLQFRDKSWMDGSDIPHFQPSTMQSCKCCMDNKVSTGLPIQTLISDDVDAIALSNAREQEIGGAERWNKTTGWDFLARDKRLADLCYPAHLPLQQIQICLKQMSHFKYLQDRQIVRRNLTLISYIATKSSYSRINFVCIALVLAQDCHAWQRVWYEEEQ